MANVFTTADNNFGVAKWIVDPNPGHGTNTGVGAIQSAINAASAGDTIFIRPGIYTENPILKAGVNLVAFLGDDDTPNVTINGNCTFSSAGTVSLGCLNLQTNSNFLLTVSGAGPSTVNLTNCFLNCTNNTGISFTSASSSSLIDIENCGGNLGTPGISMWSSTSPGILLIEDCFFSNSGASSLVSSASAGSIDVLNSNLPIPIGTTGTAGLLLNNSYMDTGISSSICLTLNGTGVNRVNNSYLITGGGVAASAITIGAAVTAEVINCAIGSNAVNAITGLGTLNFAGLVFQLSSSTINGTLTQNPLTWKPFATAGTTGTAVRGTAGFDSNFFTDVAGFVSGSGTGIISSITGNSGGAEIPIANNFNILGTGSITVAGSANTEIVQVTGLTNHNVLVGAGTATITKVPPSATSGVPLISQGAASDPTFGTAVVAGGGTGDTSFTAFAPIAGGTTATGNLQSASTGQATSGFVFTSTGNASLPTFQAVSASGAITTITGNSGGAESPLSGNFNVIGTGSITVAGSANTETVQLTGLTNHSVLVGAGTATITNVGPSGSTGQVLQNNAAADPSYSTATYPSTTTINQLLYSSAANTITGLAAVNKAVLTTGATGIPVETALASDGQLIIGSTAGVPAAATLTAGSGIVVTNASNSITVAVNGSSVIQTITGNTGGAESPSAGNFNVVGTGSITVAGSANTETVQLTGLTAHNVLLGEGTATVGLVAPSATSGVPLISQGAAADPAFGTAVVAGGGTGATTLTAHGVLVGEGTSPITALAVGTTGQLLVGATGADPAFGSSAAADFTFTSAVAGATRTLTVSNTDNTNAASSALLKLSTGGTSAGDPFELFTNGTTNFSVGLDNEVTPLFKISASNALGTTDVMTINTSGSVLKPLQPMFLATHTAAQNTVTGAGTTVTVTFPTSIFDQQANFNTGTSTFTAPVTGKYHFDTAVSFSLLAGANTTGSISIVTTAATFNGDVSNYGAGRTAANTLVVTMSCLANMTAGDTAIVQTTVSGNGANNVTIPAGASQCYFSGNLVG